MVAWAQYFIHARIDIVCGLVCCKKWQGMLFTSILTFNVFRWVASIGDPLFASVLDLPMVQWQLSLWGGADRLRNSRRTSASGAVLVNLLQVFIIFISLQSLLRWLLCGALHDVCWTKFVMEEYNYRIFLTGWTWWLSLDSIVQMRSSVGSPARETLDNVCDRNWWWYPINIE